MRKDALEDFLREQGHGQKSSRQMKRVAGREQERMIAGRLKLKHEQISIVFPTPTQLQSPQWCPNGHNFGPQFLTNPFRNK
jgi:hypothetical protein